MTVIASGDAKAVKKFSAFLAIDTPKKAYWTQRYMGKGAQASMPIQQIDSLESDAGEEVSYDLNMQMTMRPVEGDDVLENKEERLKFYSDSVKIVTASERRKTRYTIIYTKFTICGPNRF